MTYACEVYPQGRGWRWRLISETGEAVYDSKHTYVTEQSARTVAIRFTNIWNGITPVGGLENV